jgi:hypothetical protein
MPQLENALLDGSEPPLLKICDFGCALSRLPGIRSDMAR